MGGDGFGGWGDVEGVVGGVKGGGYWWGVLGLVGSDGCGVMIIGVGVLGGLMGEGGIGIWMDMGWDRKGRGRSSIGIVRGYWEMWGLICMVMGVRCGGVGVVVDNLFVMCSDG